MSTHTCEGCGNVYATKQGKCAHKSKNPICKLVKSTDGQVQYAAIVKELSAIKERLEQLERGGPIVITDGVNTTMPYMSKTYKNITHNVTKIVNSFGHEYMPHVSHDYVKKMIKVQRVGNIYTEMMNFVREQHLNEHVPQNLNVYIPDEEHAFVIQMGYTFRNGEWRAEEIFGLVQSMINDVTGLMQTHALDDPYKKEYTKTEIRNLEWYIQNSTMPSEYQFRIRTMFLECADMVKRSCPCLPNIPVLKANYLKKKEAEAKKVIKKVVEVEILYDDDGNVLQHQDRHVHFEDDVPGKIMNVTVENDGGFSSDDVSSKGCWSSAK